MKLSNELRSSVVGLALEHAFGKRLKAHEKARTALADAVFNYEFGAGEKLARKLPTGWCMDTCDIVISHPAFGNRYSRKEGFTIENGCLKLSKSRLRPWSLDSVKIDAKHPLRAQADEVAQSGGQLRKERDELGQKVRALLNSCTTLKQLHERWPEGAKFYPKDEKVAATALVPVELTAEINRRMGIAK